ncbi:hypothetical protein PV326_004277, partial [Microctonus aethiopoides]
NDAPYSTDWIIANLRILLGPGTWPDLCQSGKRQSPIDILTDHTLKVDLGSLKFIRYDYAYSGFVTNTGHNVQITLSGIPVYVTGGGLASMFILEQLHFHWDAEHTIDGVRDALELHFVHYDKKYGNLSNASHYQNGICVVAFADDDNSDLYNILNATESVSQWVGKSSVEMQRKVVPMLLLPKDRTTYYRYDGSLTTPGCQEAVTWFILTEKLPISESQVNILRNVKTNNGTLKHNFRPTQNQHNRIIYHHLLGYTSTAVMQKEILPFFNFIYVFIIIVYPHLFITS